MKRKKQKESATSKAVKNTIAEGKGKNSKELMWIIFIMAGLIVLLLVSSFIFRSLNKFEYQGLTFTRENYGKIPVFHYYYYFDDKSGQQYKYNLYLRNDPRENTVPVYGNILLPEGRTVYLSINGTEIATCNNSMREISTLSAFLNNNLFTVKAGTPDKEEAAQNNLTYVTCQSKLENAVITVQNAGETSITANKNCFTINVSQCQLLDAVEKFEVQSILDAKNKNLF